MNRLFLRNNLFFHPSKVCNKNIPMITSSFFHSTSSQFKNDDDKVSPINDATISSNENENSPLNDWKIMTPIGLAVAIPAINNGIYVINEETQLACCFALFCTSVYKFGGDMIASFFDEKAKIILNEQNAIEDLNIKISEDTVKAHELQLAMVDDIKILYDAQKEMSDLLCKVESQKLRHQVRDVFQKNLDTIVAYENIYMNKMQDNMVKYATENVRKTVESGDKTIKQNAFNDALSTLSTKENAEEDDKTDEIVSLFCKNLHEYANKIEKAEGTTIQLSPDQKQQVASDLEVYLKRVNMDLAVKADAPNEIKFELIK